MNRHLSNRHLTNRHLTSEEISSWMIGERTPEAARHALECPPCRAELDRLQNAFSLFRESGRNWSARCYASMPLHPLPAQRPWQWGRLSWAGMLTAAVFIGALLVQRPDPGPQFAKSPMRSSEAPFIEIPYVAPLAPYERTNVVRMNVQVAALIAAGFEVHAPDAGTAVSADVLFGQDGRAHAIRLVPTSKVDSDRRLDQ